MINKFNLVWPAPAKINWFLHITGRRADGYHELQTAFQFVEFGDTLQFELTDDAQVQLLTPLPNVNPDHDLTVRAARLLQTHTRVTQGANIRLQKNIPLGGGLGGGSSDAATTLVALNHLWNTQLTLTELAQLGLSLGADVPVFVQGHAAWAEGVGEQLTPITLPEQYLLLILPPVSVATATIFQDPHLTRDCPPSTIRDLLSGACRNVCEPVTIRHYPLIGEAMAWLNGHTRAYMSGTGSTVFGFFTERALAENCLAALQKQLPSDFRGVLTRGMNRSTLHFLLDDL
ncbi:MAG: 4-(cytidine 5'-diphospho)-2-C-methyl-D-erythritol kinase [Gammaproteobacteria bacterium]|nr:4-(cytidine 5'-diphospho)-2-C-methyl-D-erythritol kinase [Gammaproteobacteria bacterium]